MDETDLKPIHWCVSSQKDLLGFPKEVRQDAGYQLHLVQTGQDPLNFSPLPHLGRGVMEIRVDEDTDTYRVIYVAKLEEAVYVLHCFQKKSKKGKTIPKRDEEVIKQRYKDMISTRPALPEED